MCVFDVIGANALVAETGYSLLVTNEGNGDLCANLPPVLIVCTTLERLLPRMSDAADLLRLLARSATGQPVTCYTSFYSGPRRPGDADGPVETHIVLLDNRRTEILASDYSDMLQCIRCGACLNHCPIYVAAGGHAYGWVYPGPVGSVLTPQPQVLGQVAVGWRQVRRMQISDLLGVVTPVRLQQHHQMAKAQTMDGKATVAIQITGILRFAPAADDQCPGFGWKGLPPGLITRQRQVIEGGAMRSLG